MMKQVTFRISAITVALLLLFASLMMVSAAPAGVLDDSANLFSGSEASDIQQKLNEASAKTGWQFIVTTTNQAFTDSDIETYADQYYNNGGFDANAIVLVIGNNEDNTAKKRIMRMKGDVKAYFAHDNSRYEDIISAMKGCGDNMYEATLAFVNKSSEIYGRGKTNLLLLSLKKVGPFAGVAGVIIAVVFFFVIKSRYKHMGTTGTYDLAANSKVDLKEMEDTYVTQHTTVRTIQKDNDSSGGSNHSDGSGSRAF